MCNGMTNPANHMLLTVAEMARADALAVEYGIPSLDLMEAAGASVAAEIRRRWPPQPVVVLCGPGNNGGDGFVIARYLAAAGWRVRLALLGNRTLLKNDANANASRWKGEIETLDPGVLNDASLVVDALFGAGLARPLGGIARDVIETINRRGLSCVAVDTPSGVDSDSGEILGVAPRCALTVTFFRKKPGHLMLPGRIYAGDIVVSDIGIPHEILDQISPQTAENMPDLWRAGLSKHQADDHKYRRGHAVIMGGAEMFGAARLAARGARRAGAGMLSIAAPTAAVGIYATSEPGNLIYALDTPNQLPGFLAKKRRNAILIGPGLGVTKYTRDVVVEALRSGIATVLDADALTVFAENPEALFACIKTTCVMTPHHGEFTRLFDTNGNKLTRARAAAARSRAVMLLKGGDTVIAHPDGRTAINTNAPPQLATAGTGDVLAGIIVGLLAQGMDGFSAACMGAWLHGAAATQFGSGLIAEDLPDQLPSVLEALK